MDEITYRPATVGDIETLAQLRWEMETERHEPTTMELTSTRERFIAGYSAEARAEVLRGAHRAWLAEVGGVPVACVLLIWWVMPSNVAQARRRRGCVSSVYTRPTYRRRGIARELMRLLLVEARELGVQRLVLWASEAGRPLYEQLGFDQSRALEINLD